MSMSTGTHEKRPSALQVFCDEPFRVFFPLGILWGVIGVSHWLWYYAGMTETYSCNYHALVQIQGFEAAFAVGFVMTALPRFMDVPGARPWELLLGAGLLVWSAFELHLENWILSELGFLALILHVCTFALRRFLKRRDDPPIEFIFVTFGLLHAIAGGLLILHPLPGFAKLGQRTVQQGMLLSFIMGIGPYLGPRLLAPSRPRVQESSAHRLALYTFAGLALMLSFWVESGPSEQLGKLLRALVVSAHLLWTIPIFRPPANPLWHLRFLWLSFWCVICGLWLAGFFPDYEIAALHVTFIGGFTLLTLTIATRVVVAHCGFDRLWEKNLKSVLTFGCFFLAALLARVASDLFVERYFGLLHNAAGLWLIGVIAWAIVFLPKMTPRHLSEDE